MRSKTQRVKVLLRVLSEAPDPEDPVSVGPLTSSLTAADARTVALAATVLRYPLRAYEDDDKLEATSVVDALLRVAPDTAKAAITDGRDFLQEVVEATIRRRNDFAVSDLRVPVIPTIVGVGWEVGLIAAFDSRRQVVGYLPRVTFALAPDVGLPISLAFDETGLREFLDQLGKAAAELETVRRAGSDFRIGGPYSTPTGDQ